MDIIEDLRGRRAKIDTEIEEVKQEILHLKGTDPNYFDNPNLYAEILRQDSKRDKLSHDSKELTDKIAAIEQEKEKTKQEKEKTKQTVETTKQMELQLEKTKFEGSGITDLTNQDDHVVTKFWKFARNFQAATLKANEVLDLGQGVFFVGEPDFGSRLFVRECYLELLDLVLTGGPKVLVRGTPGIGKTHFSFLLALCLISEGKTVVCERFSRQRAFLFSHTEVKSAQRFTDFGEVESTDTFLILDAIDVDAIGAKTILVSSPNQDNFHEFIKRINLATDSYFMSPWSLEEILGCNSKMYHRDDTQVKEGVEKVGGVPRLVLENYPIDISSVRSAMNQTRGFSLSRLSEFLKDNTQSQVSGKVFHMIASADFRSFYLRFASKWVETEVLKIISENTEDAICAFIRSSRDLGEAGGLSGILFERVAHLRLEEGGEFNIRSLDERSKETKLTLRRSEWKRFDNIDEVAGFDEGDYLVPKSSILESVDSMKKPNLLFQMTVSTSHPCKQAGLLKAIRALSEKKQNGPSVSKGGNTSPEKKRKGPGGQSMPVLSPIRLFFVVPDDLFDAYQTQRYVGVRDQPLNNISADVAAIQQFVLRIKY